MNPQAAEKQINKAADTDGKGRPCYIDAIAEMPPAKKDPRDEERGAGPEQAPKQQEPEARKAEPQATPDAVTEQEQAAAGGPAGTTTPADEQLEEPRPEGAEEKQAYDYGVLLNCREIAELPCFGGYKITPKKEADGPHKYDKRPIDIVDPASKKDGEKDGVYRFVHKAEKALEIIDRKPQTAGVKYALGIHFGEDTEIDYYGKNYTLIGVDIDGAGKPMDTPAGYWEASASRTGQHILVYVPAAEIMGLKNKVIKNAEWIREHGIPEWDDDDGEDVEIFVGVGNGIALTGYNAIARKSMFLHDDGSRMSRLVYGILSAARAEQAPRRPAGPQEPAGGAPAARDSTAGAKEEPEKTPEELRAQKEREKADIDAVENYAVIHYTMSKYPNAEGKASEVFQSVANKIAIDLAKKAAARARNPKQAYPPEDVINAGVIRKIWEQTEVYRCLYGPQGGHKYNESKITTTIGKAVECGLDTYYKAVAGRQAPKPKTERDSKPVTGTLRKSENAGRQAPAPKRESEEEPQPDETDIAAARELWAGEDTLTKIITKLQKIHVGDTELMKLLLLLFVQGRIDNLQETTYLTIHAERGSGKSHLIETVKAFLPPKLIHAGGMSNKYLTRMGEDWDGSMIVFDDIRLSEDIAEIVKICSVHGKRPVYKTLEGASNKPREYNLPMNLIFVFSSVDADYGPDEEQIMNRNIVAYTRDDEEQARDTYDMIRKRAALNYTASEGITKIGAVFWRKIPKHILVDCEMAAHISVPKGADNRALQQCITLAMCFAVYRHWQGDAGGWGEKDESGLPIIQAGKQDIIDAIDMMNRLMRGDGGDIDLKLPKGPKEVYNILMTHFEHEEWLSMSDMHRALRKCPAKYDHDLRTLTRAVNGRKERGTGGLVGTITGLTHKQAVVTMIDYNQTGKKTSTHEEVYIWDRGTEIEAHAERFFRWSDEILSIHSSEEEGQTKAKTEQSTII